MNDDFRLERIIADGLHELTPTRAPDRVRIKVKAETGEVAPRPRWLALIKEPPMRTNSRLAVGSPTWRVAVIMAATVLVAALVVGASFAGAQLVAKDGFIVDASGGGTHTSIAAAVADAEEGFDIFVRPGTYEEAIELDKTVSIIGDGPREAIIVTAPEGGPTVPLIASSEADPYAIHVTGGEPTVSGITFRGQPSELIITGGTATLEDLAFEDVGRAFDGVTILWGGSSILAQGPDARVVVRRTDLLDGGPIATYGGAVATIESNRLQGGPHLFLPDNGPGTSVLDNHVSGTVKYGLNIHDTTGTEISGNTFTDAGEVAIRVRDGGDGLISDNVVAGGSLYGIGVDAAHGLQVLGNTISDLQFGIAWKGGDGILESNTVTGNASGIIVSGGAPVVIGNTACDNSSTNFAANGASDPDVGENDFCPEPVASS